jgi:iron complex outermembrane recepter protein
MQRDLRKILMLGWSAAAIAAGGQAAFAAPAGGEPQATAGEGASVGEVVVTARRRDEKLRDVPVSATVIDAVALAQRGGGQSVGALLSDVPGVRFFNTSSPNNSEVSMRASGTSRSSNSDPSVGLYRNDMFIAGGFLGGRSYTVMDLFDVGQVEVLRGVQGALYGRDAVGGAINVVSARPSGRDEGFADVRYGVNNAQTQVQLVVNHPLADWVSVRLGGDYYNQSKGFFYLPDLHQYLDRQNGYGLRGQVNVHPAGRFEANLMVENQVMDVPALYQQLSIAAGASGFPLGYVQPKYAYPWNTRGAAKQNQTSVILEMDYDLDWAKAKSTTGYRDRSTMIGYDTDFVDAATLAALHAAHNGTTLTDSGASQSVFDTTRLVYEDLHLAGAKIGGFSWLVGGEYLHQSTAFVAYTHRTPTQANASPGARAPSHLDYDSGAVYASLGYDLTDRLNVTGEARYTKDDERFTANRYDLGTGLQSGGARYVIDGEQTPDNVSYDLTASYRLPRGWLAYLKMGAAYRAGGFNQDQGDPRESVHIPVSYGPETTTAYEVGLKGNPLPALFVTAAAYRNITNDVIVQLTNDCLVTNPACPVAASSYQTNAGKAHIWGLEIEGSARAELAGGKANLTFSASRQAGKIVQGPYAGDAIPQVPETQASANFDYRHPAGEGITLFGDLNYTAAWGGVQELVQKPPLRDYQTLDARLGVGWRMLELSAFAENLTNASYIIYSTATAQRWNEPRVYGVELRYHW